MHSNIEYFKSTYTPLCFGGASISGEGAGYGFGDITESDAVSLLHYAYDRGIKVFDTAPIYGFRESEKRIGKAFKDKRENVCLISKCGVSWHDNMRVNMTNDPKTTRKMLEQSLKDLQSDYIDLYMVHWPDESVDIRHTVEVLAKAKVEGKIKHIGLCNTNEDEFLKASEVERIECLQSQFNYFERAEVDNGLKLAHENNIPFMSWGTFEKGILTGRVTKDRTFAKSDCRSWAPWWVKSNKDEKMEKFKFIKEVLDSHGISPENFAIQFNLKTKGLSHILCGARNHEQIDSCLKATTSKISDQVFMNILEVLNEPNS